MNPGQSPQAAANQPPDDLDRLGAWFGLGLALVLGGLVRALPLVRTDFPLNDGGLFATMIQDLVANGFRLPASTSYNGLDIPFAYPPLAFYLVAAAQQSTGVTVPDALRFMPLVFSVATIPAIYWLATGILGSRFAGVLAAMAFALLPRAYLFLIPGGGITRGVGLLLALLALGIGYRVIMGRYRARLPTVAFGLLGGLTVLAHPQAGVFMASGAALFLAFAPDRRRGLAQLVAAGMIGLVVVTPWLVAVLAQHGPAPLLSAARSGEGGAEGLLLLASLRFSNLLIFDVLTIVGLFGFLVALRRRAFLLPAWLVLIWLVDSRAGPTFSMVPLSMLAAMGLSAATEALPKRTARPLRAVVNHPFRAAAAVAIFSGLVLANAYSGLHVISPAHALTADQRAAQQWVGEHLGETATVAVVTGSYGWWNDASAEWFPELAGARSAATVQGFEWLGADAWERQKDAYAGLQGCARDVLPCVLSWSDTYALPITHVFLPKGQLHGPLSEADCCPAIRHSIELVPGARVIYDGPGATVIELP